MNTLLVLSLILIIVRLGSAADWGYDEHGHGQDTGPSVWKSSFPACGGSRQSPIDIVPSATDLAEGIGRFKFNGYDTLASNYSYTLKNNGHTVQLDINAGDIWIKGAALADHYKLSQLHVHWGANNNVGSEHTVSKKSYPLEIHFVHYNSRKYANVSEAADKPAGLAVIGVFGQVDKVAFPNEALQKIIDEFTKVRYNGISTKIEAFNLAGMLPNNLHEFYRYTGSLTTPPCYESVIWTVMREPLKISPIQLNAFRTLSHNSRAAPDAQLADNFRPTQPVGTRTVYRSFQLPTAAPQTVVYRCAACTNHAPISVLLLVAMATFAKKLASNGCL